MKVVSSREYFRLQQERLGLRLISADAALFVKHAEVIAALYQAVYGGTVDDAMSYIQSCATLDRLYALLLLGDDGSVIAAQWSFEPDENQFHSELRNFIAQHRMTSQEGRTLVFGRHILVHPDFQRLGLGLGLRLMHAQSAKERHPNGVLLLSRILVDNHASIATARLAGLSPTGIFDPTSAEPRQYWYGAVG